MGVEFELKYRATPEQLDRVRKTLPGQEQQILMQTDYYDTPSASLSARHYTLRRRRENETSVCTLKYPVEGLGRGEIEVVCENLEDALDRLCCKSGLKDLPALLKEGLVQVCGARFTRIAKKVVWQGAVLELALDEGVLTGGGKEVPLCEVEVELKEGSPEAVRSCGVFLQTAFSLELEERSKFRRALALQRGE